MRETTRKPGMRILAFLLMLAVFAACFALPNQTMAEEAEAAEAAEPKETAKPAEKGFTGLKIEKGKYVYYTNGKVDRTTKTLARVNGKGALYFVKNGTVDWKKTGLFKYKGVYYYIKKGKWYKKFKGFVKRSGKWLYLKKGKQDLSFKGLVKKGNYWLYVEKGAWNKKFNGKVKMKGYPRKFKVRKGRVSCGVVPPNAKLAKRAEKIIKKYKINTLKKAFNYSCCPYVSYNASGALGLAHYADFGLRHHYGNCYVMAGLFCILARELGYEAYQVSGSVNSLSGGYTPHSWAEVKVNGRWYVCDPDQTVEGGMYAFLIQYGTPGSWHGFHYSRMRD